MKKPTKKEAQLKRVYYNPRQPGSYGGIDPLSRATKTKRFKVKSWLSGQDTYTLHRPVKRKFQRQRVIVGGIDHQWQADLVEVGRIKQHNKGYRYLLTCIDVFSKYAWVIPLKDKTGKSLVAAFQQILRDGRKPLRLQTDKGTEFTNRHFQKYLRDNHIHFFTTHNEETKACIVERFNRTFKSRMWRYFTYQDTHTYINILEDLVHAYNNTYHRSIGMTPAKVNTTNSEQVWQKLYGTEDPLVKEQTLAVGDLVRLSQVKRAFKKGYMSNWTREIFTVVEVKRGQPTVYRVADGQAEVLEGTFYYDELQKVAKPEVYKVESILQERKQGRAKQYLVKWEGYPATFNCWINASDFCGYKKGKSTVT